MVARPETCFKTLPEVIRDWRLDVAERFRHDQPMAARAVSADQQQWERVSRRVNERRLALDLTAEELAALAGRGLTPGVLSQIENARKPSYAARTLTALCRGLGWTPDSIERILDDGEPLQAGGDDASMAERMERLEAALDRFTGALNDLANEVRSQRDNSARNPST